MSKEMSDELQKIAEHYCKSVPENMGKILSEAVVSVKRSVKHEETVCDWCGKGGASIKLLHSDCYEAILNGEGVV